MHYISLAWQETRYVYAIYHSNCWPMDNYFHLAKFIQRITKHPIMQIFYLRQMLRRLNCLYNKRDSKYCKNVWKLNNVKMEILFKINYDPLYFRVNWCVISILSKCCWYYTVWNNIISEIKMFVMRIKRIDDEWYWFEQINFLYDFPTL